MLRKKRAVVDENRTFKEEWTYKYAFIEKHGVPYCLICKHSLSQNKKWNIERHFVTKHIAFSIRFPEGETRKEECLRLLNELKEQDSSSNNRGIEGVATAGLTLIQEILQRGRPFSDGEYIKTCMLEASQYLFASFPNKDKIIKQIQDMQLSAKQVQQKAIKMAEDIERQQLGDIESSVAFSLALSEITTPKSSSQCVILARYVCSTGIKEEILCIIPLKSQNMDEYVFNAVCNYFMRKHQLHLGNLVAVCTDGSKDIMTGFMTLFLQSLNRSVISYHCIAIHENFCVQSLPNDLQSVLGTISKIISFVVTQRINCPSLVNEVQNHSSSFPLHSTVHWIFKGKILVYFVNNLKSIKNFLEQKQPGLYTELRDCAWLQKLYYIMDVVTHFSELNLNLKRRGLPVYFLQQHIIAFESRLKLYISDMRNGTLRHFHFLKEYQDSCKHMNQYLKLDTELFGSYTEKILDSYVLRIADLRKLTDLSEFIIRPHEMDLNTLNLEMFDISLGDFEIQMLEFKEAKLWVDKFRELNRQIEELERRKAQLHQENTWTEIDKLPAIDLMVTAIWQQIPDDYYALKKLAYSLLTVFGSSYLLEQLCSNAAFTKTKAQMNEISFEACMRLQFSSYTPDFQVLSQEVQYDSL